MSTLEDRQQEGSSKPYVVVSPVHFTITPAAGQRPDTPAVYAAPVHQIERMDVNQRNGSQAAEAAPPQQVHYGLLAQQRDTLKDQILASKQLKRGLEPNSAGLSVDFEKVTTLRDHTHAA